jgi:RimJ/RimL family protein N-acetyltransferase
MHTYIRLAEKNDVYSILEWRNQPDVREASRENQEIDLYSHESWFATRLLNIEKEPLFIFLAENKKAGTGRLDCINFESRKYEVSILLAPEFRSQGLGFLFLSKVCDYSIRYLDAAILIAEIRSSNLASQKIFEKMGFQISRITNETKIYTKLIG